MKTMAGVQNAYVSSYSEYPNAAQLLQNIWYQRKVQKFFTRKLTM